MMVGGWASVGWEGGRSRGRGEASASEWSGAVNSLCVQRGWTYSARQRPGKEIL